MSASDDVESRFSTRLRARRLEIEADLLNRVDALRDTGPDEAYTLGLRSAVSALLDFGLEAIERGSTGSPPEIPERLRAQARLAARRGIALDGVLRRYYSANALLTDALIGEAEGSRLSRGKLQGHFRSLARSFEGLLATVSEEYGREESAAIPTWDELRTELIERLLSGELIEGSELSYDFTAWHLGLLGFGVDAQDSAAAHDTLREIFRPVDAQLLAVRRRDGVVWAWLGARDREELSVLSRITHHQIKGEGALALGEPARGLAGWRLTHRQAVAALPLAIRGPEPIARYGSAPLLVTALKDDLLATSLRQLFLTPLSAERDGGEVAKSTLRAYYQASGNASSAAAALGVNRRTIAARLANIEERLGHRLDAFSAEIETALRLDALERPRAPQRSQ